MAGLGIAILEKVECGKGWRGEKPPCGSSHAQGTEQATHLCVAVIPGESGGRDGASGEL